MSKDAEPSRGSKSKESKSSSSKGSKSQPKSFGKSAQAKEPVFEAADTKMPLNQGNDLGNTDDQPNVETWISKIAKAEKPPLTFDELMSTPINFSTYVMNNLKIKNLTQEYLVGPAFNLLKGTCKSQVELEYHFKECYKAVSLSQMQLITEEQTNLVESCSKAHTSVIGVEWKKEIDLRSEE
ncbi:hypothetical protein Tco_1131733 [Tanacetum coccineum]|uniref:Uncharacterized protein n=1 Tax=Tanacetum coccineum TaxID=301880 RepID=A0ABQ5J9X4_9ASTR